MEQAAERRYINLTHLYFNITVRCIRKCHIHYSATKIIAVLQLFKHFVCSVT